jgi:hypothetical protein
MAPSRATRRSQAGRAGLKALITAASFGATLTGWALLAGQDGGAAAPQAALDAPVTQAAPDIPALPTLVPSGGDNGFVPAAPATPAPVAPSAAAPAAQAPPALRNVPAQVAPQQAPRAFGRTRSSR